MSYPLFGCVTAVALQLLVMGYIKTFFLWNVADLLTRHMAESPGGTNTEEHEDFEEEQAAGDAVALAAAQEDLASEHGVYVRGGQGSFDGAYHTPPEDRYRWVFQNAFR